MSVCFTSYLGEMTPHLLSLRYWDTAYSLTGMDVQQAASQKR